MQISHFHRLGESAWLHENYSSSEWFRFILLTLVMRRIRRVQAFSRKGSNDDCSSSRS